MIERKQLTRTIGGRDLTMWEANWDMSNIPDRIREEALRVRSEVNGTGDYDLLDFHETIYPWLFAYSTGNVPTLEEAYELPDKDLDDWFDAIRSTNPDLFPDDITPPTTVILRDGSQIVVVSSRLPSSLRRLSRLENEATRQLDLTKDPNVFARREVYAKLACCSTGNVPTFDEAATQWPATELQRWYEAVLRTNPSLFLTPKEAEKKDTEDREADLAKKKSSPGKSSNTFQASSKAKAKTSRQSST